MTKSDLDFSSLVQPALSDVVIVGGGLAGSLAATLLARSGLQVTLVDIHETYPTDFRAEQLVGSQVETLSELGLLDLLVEGVVPAERAVATRAGRTVGVVSAPHYGILYESMVNRARRHLPASVRFIKAQVDDIELSTDRQRVRLADRSIVEARLVVVATGLGQRLLRKVEIAKKTVRDAHSLTFGFDAEVEFPALFTSSVLVAYGEKPEGAIDYLTIFPIANKLRGNLFTYGDHRDDWTKRFLQDAAETLRQALPYVEQLVGRIEVAGKVQLRVNDLKVASNYQRDGLVLIGDVFQTSCPAAGTGIGRLLNDVDRLCNWYIPKWLRTDGMSLTKIDQFYSDVLKKRCDAEALRVAEYRRSLTISTGLTWKIHRQRVALQNQLRLLAQRKLRPKGDPAATSWGHAGMAPIPLPPANSNRL